MNDMKKDSSRREIVAVRLSPKEKRMIEEMCGQSKKTYSELLRELIVAEYDKQNLRDGSI